MTAMIPYDEEILDLVDENDQVVGTVTHQQAFDRKNLNGHYLRAVNAFIVNGKGQLWVPRRRPEKIIVPNGLDFSVGEHVMSGEAYDTAIVRGFQEEVNITLTIDQLTLFSKSVPPEDDSFYFCNNYFYLSDDTPDYNKDDFTGAEWLEPQELISRLQNGDVGKRTIVQTVRQLLDYKSEHGGYK